jgi:uncharacterized membrane protein
MISKWRWLILQLTRKLWVRATLLAVLGVVTALASIVLEQYLPWQFPGKIGADAVDNILNILASSMLAVTTFSLSVMVAAYASATSNVTPRATKLLMQDSTTQNVLATFIGSFLFSLVGLIALSMGAYGERGRGVLFIATLAVIVLIVITILRWIDHLSRLGRVGETTDRVEKTTTDAIKARIKDPCLGGRPLLDPEKNVPESALPIYSERVGYIQHVDISSLSQLGDAHHCNIYLAALPGSFVHPVRPLVWIETVKGEDLEQRVRKAFTIDDERSFDQDPRFGLVVLAEIGSRALSPAINDPGTAIDVIGRGMRLLTLWRDCPDPQSLEDVSYPRVWVRPLDTDEMFNDLYASIARDGAAMFEVQIRLLKALLALAHLGDGTYKSSAARVSKIALERAEAAILVSEEITPLREVARQIAETIATASIAK